MWTTYSNVCFSCFSCEDNLYMLKEILRRHVVFTSIAAQENTPTHMNDKFYFIFIFRLGPPQLIAVLRAT